MQADLALRLDVQGLGYQFMVLRPDVKQNFPGRRFVVVKLSHEGAQHLFRIAFLAMAGEIGAVAPVLPGPEEKYLDAADAGLHMNGDNVRLGYIGHVDALVGLNMGQGAQAVPVDGGGL